MRGEPPLPVAAWRARYLARGHEPDGSQQPLLRGLPGARRFSARAAARRGSLAADTAVVRRTLALLARQRFRPEAGRDFRVLPVAGYHRLRATTLADPADPGCRLRGYTGQARDTGAGGRRGARLCGGRCAARLGRGVPQLRGARGGHAEPGSGERPREAGKDRRVTARRRSTGGLRTPASHAPATRLHHRAVPDPWPRGRRRTLLHGVASAGRRRGSGSSTRAPTYRYLAGCSRHRRYRDCRSQRRRRSPQRPSPRSPRSRRQHADAQARLHQLLAADARVHRPVARARHRPAGGRRPGRRGRRDHFVPLHREASSAETWCSRWARRATGTRERIGCVITPASGSASRGLERRVRRDRPAPT